VGGEASVTIGKVEKPPPKAGWLDWMRIRLVAGEKEKEYEQDDEDPPASKPYDAASCLCPFGLRHQETLLSIFAVSRNYLSNPISNYEVSAASVTTSGPRFQN
jgi:hypothetical protein